MLLTDEKFLGPIIQTGWMGIHHGDVRRVKRDSSTDEERARVATARRSAFCNSLLGADANQRTRLRGNVYVYILYGYGSVRLHPILPGFPSHGVRSGGMQWF
jgi:hypothetical protein